MEDFFFFIRTLLPDLDPNAIRFVGVVVEHQDQLAVCAVQLLHSIQTNEALTDPESPEDEI